MQNELLTASCKSINAKLLQVSNNKIKIKSPAHVYSNNIIIFV